MKKIICCPKADIPNNIAPDVEYFSLYSSIKPKRDNVSYFARQLKADIRKAGLLVTHQAWDFATIALSVAAADSACSRLDSADGWTRQIELDIYLQDPLLWHSQISTLERTFRFLTGDFWKLRFIPGGLPPPRPNGNQIRSYDSDCVSLLSGGVDSLVGAIDLSCMGKNPLFISKIVPGDKDIQHQIAARLNASERHLQWSFTSPSPNEHEPSGSVPLFL